MIDYYQVLGVSPEAETEVISAAFKAMMRKYHPDANKSADAERKAKQINEAYETLKDPSRRANYDLAFKKYSEQRSAPAPPPPSPPPRSVDHSAHRATQGASSANILLFLVVPIAVLIGIVWLGSNSGSPDYSTVEDSASVYNEMSSPMPVEQSVPLEQLPPPEQLVAPRSPIQRQATIPRSAQAAPPAPPPAPSMARGPRTKNERSWASRIQLNYPARALREEIEGTVGVRVTVAHDGWVTGCSVTASSGSDILDAAACQDMKRYARFEPALDAAGNPTNGSYSTRITYRLN